MLVTNTFSPIQEAVINSEAPSMSLISVAGSGKTFTLLQKLIKQVEDKTLPKRTLLIAFNKAIKEEWEKYDLPITCMTFHSLGLRILREFGSKCNIQHDKYKKTFNLNALELKTLSEIRKHLYFTEHPKTFLIEKIKEELTRNDVNPDRASTIYRAWSLGINDLMTEVNFDDMIYGPIELNNKSPKYLKKLKMGFDLVVIDEVQDASLSQINLLNIINPQNVYICGDPFQCQPTGTTVSTVEGDKKIEDLKINDHVNTVSNTNVVNDTVNEITDIRKRFVKENLIVVTTEDGEVSKYSKNHHCIIYDKKFKISNNKFKKVYAWELKENDKVFSRKNLKFVKIKLSKEYYEGYLYSLEVSGNNLYIADGLVTHNCIYQFNGSDPWTMKVLQDKYNTKDFRLNESRRCSKAVAFEASKIVPDFKALNNAKPGLLEFNSTLPLPFNEELTILSRWNKALVQVGLKLLEKNIPFYYRQDIIKPILNTLKRYTKSQDTMIEANVKIFKRYEKRKADTILTGMTEFEKDIYETLINITSDKNAFNTIEDLINSLSKMGKNKNCTILSTIHSYKGLENENIICLDYNQLQGYAKSLKLDAPENSEINCQYVAITRAKNIFLTRETTEFIESI